MEWNFLVYLWLRVEEHRLHELINFWNNRPDVVLISPISPIKKHRKKEKKKRKRVASTLPGFTLTFYLREAEFIAIGRVHFPFCRITKMRRILGEREISTFCILLLFCPFDLSVCLPAEQPIRYTLNTGNVETRDTGTPFNFEQNRVSI